MKIGIIGAGSIGSTLARKLSEAGHDVRLANSRGRDTLANLVLGTGIEAVDLDQVTDGRDVVFLSVPFAAAASLATSALTSTRAVVVDTTNYVPRQRDGRIDDIEDGLVESGWIERQIGHSVVKALNTVRADSLGTRGVPAGTPGRIAVPMAADRDADRTMVGELVNQLGFDVVDAGPISESWRQQPGTPIYVADLDLAHAREALRDALPERSAAWRA